MKTRKFSIYIIGVIAFVFAFTSCIKDLDTVPLDKDEVTSAAVYTADLGNYTSVLAKLYAGLAVSGQEGPSGMGDISGLDEGFGQYLRGLWYAQELPTDEALISWNDGNLRDFHDQDWTAANEFVTAFYYRIFYQVSLCNEFLRETTAAKLSERGMSASNQDVIATYRAEARFLRALSYWHALDLFGSVPFVTEADPVGSFFPEQISRTDLFNFIESELKDINDDLVDARANDYARADKAAAWTLLAKLYLNAEIYTGTGRYTDCITYCNYVMGAGYVLDPDFENLFLADNENADGVIFPVAFDGVKTKTWGGTTFIIHAAVGGSMTPGQFGIDGGWAGIRTTKSIVSKFMDVSELKSKPQAASKAYPVIYVPGDHNGWAHDATSAVASINSDNNYEGYFWMTSGGGFKFDSSDNWTEDYGDNEPDGTLDGPGGAANIFAPEDGYFFLTVDWTAKTYTIEKTDWGLIGDATPGGWSDDTNMTYNSETGEWELIVELSTGKIKFRANDGWDINYGDTGVDGILEAGGSDIDIVTPGKYLITLKLGMPDYTYTITPYASDERKMFYTDGQELEIADLFTFTDGYAVTKFKNVTSGGSPGSHATFADTDFPMFRIADVYLMYAEAVLRGGTGGDFTSALNRVNEVLTRAYGGSIEGNIDASELNLEFILDERARELLWEGHRRTDLVRFGKFSDTDYLWAWKGGIAEGKSVDSKFDMYPIPASDIAANPNLSQTGY